MASRAVVKEIGAGQDMACPKPYGGCGELVRFNIHVPRPHKLQVIANVYWNGKWERVEHWHLACYLNAGQPYGRLRDLKFGDQLMKALKNCRIGTQFSEIVKIPLR